MTTSTRTTRRPDMNSVEIKGRLARDPELRYTSAGCPLIQFSIAYKHVHKDQEKVFFFDVVQFGDQAEDNAQRLKKGKVVEVYGRLEQNKWIDSRGELRSKVQIVAKSAEPTDEELEDDQDPVQEK